MQGRWKQFLWIGLMWLAGMNISGWGQANLLTNPGFEVMEVTGPEFAIIFNNWGGDASMIVSEENGVMPVGGTNMLRFLSSGSTNTNCNLCIVSEVFQHIDLSGMSNALEAGMSASLSAEFNRVDLDAQTDRDFEISISAFTGTPVEVWTQPTTEGRNAYRVGFRQVIFSSDDQVSTWESLSATLTIPPNTTFITALVAARENISNNPYPDEYDGHYVDDVYFTIVPQPRVTNTIPVNGEVGVASNSVIRVEFNAGIDPSSVNTDTLSVRGNCAGDYSGVFSFPATNVVEFDADTDFTLGERVAVAVSTNVLSTLGVPAQGYGFEFVVADPDPYAVVFTQAPSWWSGVIDNGQALDDYTVVNQGQVLYLVSNAYDYVASTLPCGAGGSLSNLVAGFSGYTNDYEAATVGQVSYTAQVFYDWFRSLGMTGCDWVGGCAEAVIPDLSQVTDDDYALANLGQVLNLFAFELEPVSLGDRTLAPTGMAYIPACTFQMGDPYGEGEANELPVHEVYVSGFYMDKFEVSNEKMREVMQWAYDQGLVTATTSGVMNAEGDSKVLLNVDDPFSHIRFTNNLFVVETGKESFPCVEVTWYGSQAFNNYRSDMEDLERCIDFTDWSCDFRANGYRLPTEAEWEKSARGGLRGHHYPWDSLGGSWSNRIDGSQANYPASGDPYENESVGATPIGYYNGGQVPAGVDMANGFELYDMAGNVWEWCWDWRDMNWYSQPEASGPDTTGPLSGEEKILRGGSWWLISGERLRCARRGGANPEDIQPGFDIGFRSCRRLFPNPAEMAYIPAGTFQMGDPYGEGGGDELPVHDVYVSGFYMDKFEVTNEKMRDVMQWAYDQGLVTATTATVMNVEGDVQELLDLDAGSHVEIVFSNGTFTVEAGRETFPFIAVNWYGAQAYCNYLSDMEGLGRCIDFMDWSCDFSMDGYRLPTEAEWEKANRGGQEGHHYSWESLGGSYLDHIDGSRANYYGSGDPYDGLWPTRVETTPVGNYDGRQMPAGEDMVNGYGLYDMTGNVWEWCWDRWNSGWYSQPGATVNDPTGPDSGFFRVLRGGGWGSSNDDDLRSARRGSGSYPASAGNNRGFRVSRRP